MDAQITFLSDDELDGVVGGRQNNGVGNTLSHGAGALPLTGDMGTGITSLKDGVLFAGSYVTGAAYFGMAAAAATGFGSLVV
jgi:hypothetical protein